MITQDYNREHNPDLPWLQLPNRDFAPYTCSSLQYGAGKIAGAYCDLREIPTRILGGWLHGWYEERVFNSTINLYEGTLANPCRQITWTTTKEHEKRLIKNGLKGRAIGLPHIYLPEKKYQRRFHSLLVMPAHSVEYTKHSWKFDEYADAIDKVRDRFETVAVCIYPACFKNGYWVESFRSRGYALIEGAHAHDRNSLERVRALMSQFEFVTTNSYGSCIAYAAAYGAKISLFGPYPELKISDFISDNSYLSRPGFVENVIEALSSSNVRAHLRELCVSPENAVARIEWGRRELGFDNKVSSAEMRRLFGWDALSQFKAKAHNLKQSVKSAPVLEVVKGQLKKALKPDAFSIEQEIRRLKKLPRGVPGISTLQGRTIHFDDAVSHIQDYERVYWNRHLDFPSVLGSPLIVDLDPRSGVALRFWAAKFPNPRVWVTNQKHGLSLAFERNREMARNAEVRIFDDIAAMQMALDGIEGGLQFLNLPTWDGILSPEEYLPQAFRYAEHLHFSYMLNPQSESKPMEMMSFIERQGFRVIMQNDTSPRRPMFQWVEKQPQSTPVGVWGRRNLE